MLLSIIYCNRSAYQSASQNTSKMKRIKTYLLTGKQVQQIKQFTRKFKAALAGKKFLPLPSYWALVPVKQPQDKNREKINSTKY